MKKLPFIRILPAFTVGILLQSYLAGPGIIYLLLLCTLVLLLFLSVRSAYASYRIAILRGSIIQIAFILAGALICSNHSKQAVNNRENLHFPGLKREIITILKKYIPGEKESGLAEALLIGYKKDLDTELSAAYSNTGTVHIIAISGMHLALIYALLIYLSGYFNGRKWLFLPRVIVILSLVWSFSFLCGAQPSILRAAVMLSFILLSQLLRRRSRPLNALAGSAFILLCIEPVWLWNIGFQLSYAAVVGILLFYRPIVGSYITGNKIVGYCWQMIAVTLSAQVFTFPLLLYHFHQFPLLFLISNLVAVPLSGLILIAEIILCVFSPLPPFASIIGQLIYLLVRFMNDFILRLDRVPGVTIKSVQISILQLFLIYFMIICICEFLNRMQARYLIIGQLCCLLIVFLRLQSFKKASGQELIIAHRFKGNTPVDLVSGQKAYMIRGDSINKYVKLKRELYRVRSIYKTGGQRVWKLGDHLISIWNGRDHIDTMKNIDLLIITGRSKPKPEFFSHVKVREVLIDGSVSYSNAKRYQQAFDSMHIICHNSRSMSTFVMSMR